MKQGIVTAIFITLMGLMVSILSGCVTAPEAPKPEVTAESVSSCLYRVHNRGVIPLAVVKDVVEALRETPPEVFAVNNNFDVYSSVTKELGPFLNLKHRAAVMGNVMLVQAGYESSWRYGEGRDLSANNTSACTEEAGLYQTSGNLNTFNDEAKQTLIPFQEQHCLPASTVTARCNEFRRCTKEPVKSFVHGHFIRASRITVRHWGPMVRKEINPWLSKACVLQLEALL
jgi:hypothetical protein